MVAQVRTIGAGTLPLAADSVDWAKTAELIRSAEAGDSTDDMIDAMTEAIFAGDGSKEAGECLTAAVRLARSELSLRSAALCLAITAPIEDTAAVDSLVASYKHVVDNPFLAPSLLEALGLLAVRSPLARADLSALLLRLRTSDSRYLLVKAAQTIGRMDAVQPDPDLRSKLDEFVMATDPAVRAEARFQLALVELGVALLAEDQPALRVRLTAARAAFARANRSEEHRPDAAMFVRLLDALLAFMALAHDPSAAVSLVGPISTLEHTLSSLATHDWHGYRSDGARIRALRALHIADALHGAAVATGTAEEWTNFASVLEGLARLHAQVRGETATAGQDGRFSVASAAIADRVFAGSLGPLLARVVQQKRLARITQEYVLAHGDDKVAQGLRALERAAAVFAFAADPSLNDGLAGQVIDLAAQAGRRPASLLQEVIEALSERRIAPWAEEAGLTSGPLPIERPDLYGDDPAVDEVVRPLLHRVAELLGDYPTHKWVRMVDVLVSIVRFTHYIRDSTQDYLLCAEDGGLGQRASEGDIQDHLFEWLRSLFGRKAVYELTRIGGGRIDTGVEFEIARFPIEVKHEFDSVSPEHVRVNFLAQSDIYATAADRIAFLIVLDLRASNAAGHQVQRRAARKSESNLTVPGLYHIRDSFWVESMPADPDLPTATTKAVVVGLVPGNRPLPSSMTTYSKRPASARKRR